MQLKRVLCKTYRTLFAISRYLKSEIRNKEVRKMNTKKLIAIMLALVLMCGCLFACGKNNDTEVNVGTESSAEGTTNTSKTEDVTQTSEPEVQTPIDIETIGGVVIVGKIGTDDNGWYIQPEQPLNITYTYFQDNPAVYTEQTRIQMFDPADDGVEKALYIGKTVTVAGTFRFYRDDFETLYFAPYTITLGKNAECSYSAPDLLPQQEPENLYDPSVPLPEIMDPIIIEDTYSYNMYMLSRETLEFMGNDFADFYIKFVDAFLNYKTECYCPDRNYAEMLSTVINYEMPLYNACAEPFEFFRHYDAEKGIVCINYKYDKETFDEIKEQFYAFANELMADVRTYQSDEEKARHIYHAISSRMTYDYSALEEFERKDDYYAYLYQSGVCVTFANVYNQLLTQVGILTTLAHCDNADTIGHTWSVVTLEGEQYFCDPTYELSYDNGTGYRFFGMNYADRTANGVGAMGIRYGRYYMHPMDESMIAQQSLNN